MATMIDVAIDTEFDAEKRLISAAAIRADTRDAVYVVLDDIDQAAISGHEWLGANVWPHLPLVECGTDCGSDCVTGGAGHLDASDPAVFNRVGAARRLAGFFSAITDAGDRIRLWAWCGPRDLVLIQDLIGERYTLPYWLHDVSAECDRLGLDDDTDLPAQSGSAHNALADAGHVLRCVEHIRVSEGRLFIDAWRDAGQVLYGKLPFVDVM